MLHPHTELRWIHDAIGFGVFATQRIPMGTVLWVLDPLDQRISPEAVTTMAPPVGAVLDHFTYRNAAGEHVLCWDHARFMNHSCEPVSLSPGVDYELAVADIEPGDEVTCDYGALNLPKPFECLCGAAFCRTEISADDWSHMVRSWDERLQIAVEEAASVAQPLLPLIPDPARLMEYAAYPHTLPSAARHRLRHPKPGTRALA